jgi:hypothetical protein
MRVRSQAVWCAGVLGLMLAPLGQGALRAEDKKEGELPEVKVSLTTPDMTILLTGTKITYRVRGGMDEEGKVLAEPWTVAGAGDIKPEEVKKLLEAIKAAWFYELDHEYGESKSPNDVVEIRVKDGERDKVVVCHLSSRPLRIPEAFYAVHDMILDLLFRETTIDKGLGEKGGTVRGLPIELEEAKSPEYTFSYTSETGSVEFDGTSVLYVVRELEYPDKRAEIPPKVVWVSRRASVTPAAAKELLEALKAAGFFELNDEYGPKKGWSWHGRTIQVKVGEREKEVFYRTPLTGGGPPPEAFAKVEKLLVDFAKRETTPKKE